MPDDLQTFKKLFLPNYWFCIDLPCCLCVQIPIQILHNVFNHWNFYVLLRIVYKEILLKWRLDSSSKQIHSVQLCYLSIVNGLIKAVNC